MKHIAIIFLIFLFCSCGIEKNIEGQWKSISRNELNNGFEIFLDTQRISAKDQSRNIWLKVVFDNLTPVSYENTENETKIIQSKQIRMELSFNCKNKEQKLTNYLIYNIDGQVAYTNWLNHPIKHYLKQESIGEDLYQNLCID